MKIAIGSDHGGKSLKDSIKLHLEARGIEVIDQGAYTTDSVDYPDYAEKVAELVLSKEADSGIVVCGTGIGISIAANKINGILCAHVTDVFSAEMSRLHNDANMIALGERITGPGLANKIVDAYVDAEFEGGRHARRVDKMRAIEAKNVK